MPRRRTARARRGLASVLVATTRVRATTATTATQASVPASSAGQATVRATGVSRKSSAAITTDQPRSASQARSPRRRRRGRHRARVRLETEAAAASRGRLRPPLRNENGHGYFQDSLRRKQQPRPGACGSPGTHHCPQPRVRSDVRSLLSVDSELRPVSRASRRLAGRLVVGGSGAAALAALILVATGEAVSRCCLQCGPLGIA